MYLNRIFMISQNLKVKLSLLSKIEPRKTIPIKNYKKKTSKVTYKLYD